MLTALIGTIVFFAVGLSSARLLRNRLSYEAWYWLHLTTYVAIFLTFLHQISAGVHFVSNPLNRAVWILLYLGTAAAILTWRVVLPVVAAWRQRLRVDRVVIENSGTTSVWFSGKRVDELGIRAGNFMLFRFLSWGHLLTAHPYSISRIPQAGVLRITVGALGDHSRRIRELRPGTLVFAEGPFGHFTADRASRTKILLIAGGAGIGPICALAEELTARGHAVIAGLPCAFGRTPGVVARTRADARSASYSRARPAQPTRLRPALRPGARGARSRCEGAGGLHLRARRARHADGIGASHSQGSAAFHSSRGAEPVMRTEEVARHPAVCRDSDHDGTHHRPEALRRGRPGRGVGSGHDDLGRRWSAGDPAADDRSGDQRCSRYPVRRLRHRARRLRHRRRRPPPV